MTSVSTRDAIERIHTVVSTATTYTAVFGAPTGTTIEERVSSLKHSFRRLARLTHPDHAPPDAHILAGQVFTTLMALRERAERALREGTYEKSFSPAQAASATTSGPDYTIRSATALYRLDSTPLHEGDYSLIFKANRVSSADTVLAKVAADPTMNPWLMHEMKIIRMFADAPSGSPAAMIRPFVPTLVDSVQVRDTHNRSHHVTVFGQRDGYVSITDILRAYPKGLDPKDAAWIARRVLAQALAASAVGVVHGALVPDHILVHPVTHDPMHIGWTHAVQTTTGAQPRITHIIDRWRAWYPDEVFRKDAVDGRTDLYMAGKTLLSLFGGDATTNVLPAHVPKQIGALIRQCVTRDSLGRPVDARRVLDDFTRFVRDAWGKEYRHLVMP